MPAQTRANKKPATSTSESLSPPEQLVIPLEPVPVDAVQRVLRTLYNLALDGNTAAAKLVIDLLKDKSDTPVFAVEDALKLIQEHLKKAA